MIDIRIAPFPFTGKGRKRRAMLEDVWGAVRAWAAREGHTYVDSYGVEGVAAC